ncbi:MAG: hypothetical protein HKN72_14480 [Gemmatimonadetes bacterium]|nr:hypothetical protein [Gemmatimonadota bacterium]
MIDSVTVRGGALAILVLVMIAVLPSGIAGQDADVAGAWTLEVETDQGVTTPSWVLEQDGTTLTGRYSSEALGQNPIRGTVDGSTIVIRFSADLQGQAIPVEYRGTLGDDGVIRGSIDIAGGMMQGSFTATRRDSGP